MLSPKLPLLLLVGLAALQAPGASAAVGPSASDRSPIAGAVERKVPKDAHPAFAGEALCTAARRRLWTKSEGWVVRRITTCR